MSGPETVRISAQTRIVADVDVAGLIATRLDEYLDWHDEDDCYAEWERPIAFVTHLIAEQSAVLVGGPHPFVKERFGTGELDFDRVRWTEADYDALVAAVPGVEKALESEPVDPRWAPVPACPGQLALI